MCAHRGVWPIPATAISGEGHANHVFIDATKSVCVPLSKTQSDRLLLSFCLPTPPSSSHVNWLNHLLYICLPNTSLLSVLNPPSVLLYIQVLGYFASTKHGLMHYRIMLLSAPHPRLPHTHRLVTCTWKLIIKICWSLTQPEFLTYIYPTSPVLVPNPSHFGIRPAHLWMLIYPNLEQI